MDVGAQPSRGRLLAAGAIIGAATCLAFAGQRWLDGFRGIPIWTLIVSALGFGAALLLLRRGHEVRTASIPTLGVLVIALPVDAYAFGGVGAPTFLAALAVPLLATFFAGTKWGIGSAIVLGVEVIALAAVEQAGVPLPQPPSAPKLVLMYAAATVGMLGFITYLAVLYERQRLANERALLASEERYELALLAADDGIFEWRPATDELFLSPVLQDFLGPGVTDSMSWSQFRALIHPDDHPVFDARSELRERRHRFALEFRLRHHLGEYMWMDCRVLVDRSKGAPDRIVGTMRDITEQKRLEALKNEFVSSVSHELRTPLTSIRGALRLVAGGAAGAANGSKVRDLLTIALRNSDRLLEIVNDLLDLQKIESGHLEISPEDLDMQLLVENVVEQVLPHAHQLGVHVDYDPDTRTELRVHSDKTRVEQVVTNLLSNAVKFSPPEARVEVSTRRTPRGIRVEVADRGPGVPEKFRGSLFEKFTQADATDDSKTPGTGLGLAISKALVGRLRGRIEYEPREGGGSRFWVELPGRATERDFSKRAWARPSAPNRSAVG